MNRERNAGRPVHRNKLTNFITTESQNKKTSTQGSPRSPRSPTGFPRASPCLHPASHSFEFAPAATGQVPPKVLALYTPQMDPSRFDMRSAFCANQAAVLAALVVIKPKPTLCDLLIWLRCFLTLFAVCRRVASPCHPYPAPVHAESVKESLVGCSLGSFFFVRSDG
jgi:hypothetical protein